VAQIEIGIELMNKATREYNGLSPISLEKKNERKNKWLGSK